MSWHFLILPDAARGEAATNGTCPAVHHGTVGLTLAFETVALHDARETTALGDADDVNPLTFLKQIGV